MKTLLYYQDKNTINIFFLVALFRNCLRRKRNRQTVVRGKFGVKGSVLNRMALLLDRLRRKGGGEEEVLRQSGCERAPEEEEGVGIQNKVEGFTTNRMKDNCIKMKGKNRIDFLPLNTGHAEQGHGLGQSFNLSCLTYASTWIESENPLTAANVSDFYFL